MIPFLTPLQITTKYFMTMTDTPIKMKGEANLISVNPMLRSTWVYCARVSNPSNHERRIFQVCWRYCIKPSALEYF